MQCRQWNAVVLSDFSDRLLLGGARYQEIGAIYQGDQCRSLLRNDLGHVLDCLRDGAQRVPQHAGEVLVAEELLPIAPIPIGRECRRLDICT